MTGPPVHLDAHRRDWEDLAALDVYWSILSDPAKRHGAWEEDEYLQSGIAEINAKLARAAQLGHEPAWGDALDFGCGAGRLTQALGRYFERAVGVDVAAAMIAAAERLRGSVENCTFVLNDEPHLRVFDECSFDLVFTTIVLQHLRSRGDIRTYVREFLRVARPGGLIIFQLPSSIPVRHRVQLRGRMYRLLRTLGVQPSMLYRRLGLQPIRMQFIPTAEVTALIERSGGSVLAVDETPVNGVVSAVYYATKRDAPSGSGSATHQYARPVSLGRFRGRSIGLSRRLPGKAARVVRRGPEFLTWMLRRRWQGALPEIRDEAGVRGTTAVESFWGAYNVNTLRLWTPRGSRRQLRWRLEQYPKFQEFADLWGDHAGKVLLDYGCGPGNDLVGFALHSHARLIIGVDISEEALSLAAQRLALHRVDPARLELIRTSDRSSTIPLADASVDYVHSQGVLHHASDPQAILAELHRVLKPGGDGCVMVYNRDSVFFHLTVAYERMIRDRLFEGMTVDDAFSRSTDDPKTPISRCYADGSFAAICERAGFQARYLGGYLSKQELASLSRSLRPALADPRLQAEQREFLNGLRYDDHGYPLHRGRYAGFGGVYRLSKARE